MQANVVTEELGDQPTKREAPSGRWIIAVDRGARLIADAISTLQNGGDMWSALEDLKTAHALVNGGAL